MGLDYVEEWREDGYFSHSVGEPETVDISGFDIAHNLDFADVTEIRTVSAGDGSNYAVGFDGQSVSVSDNANSARKVVFDLTALAESVRGIDLNYNDPESTSAMTLDATENGLRVRLYVEHINGRRTGFGANQIDYGSGLLLIGRGE